MLKALSTPRYRNRTFIQLAACVLLALAAAAVGVDDNPPGLLLAFLAAAALTLAFVHPWKSTKSFRHLMYASGIGFIVSVFLHNAFHAVAAMAGETSLVHDLFGGMSVAFFLVAILLCPPAFLVGAGGAVVMSRREKGKGDRNGGRN